MSKQKYINREKCTFFQTSKQSTHKLDQFKTPTRTTKKGSSNGNEINKNQTKIYTKNFIFLFERQNKLNVPFNVST